MLFIHTIDKVLSGEKTQTRRIMTLTQNWATDYEDHYTHRIVMNYSPSAKMRRVYEVGKTYAVQPGRGKPAVARIQITGIRREDVRLISLDDAHAEGFTDEYEFMRVWLSMHDKELYKREYWGMKSILEHPAERYQAWVLDFKLVAREREASESIRGSGVHS